MVGCRINRSGNGTWLSGLLRSKFFDSCDDHGEMRKNEKNLYCMDCNLCVCKHCATCSSHDRRHRLLQICKYVYHDVVRLHDIQKHLDCTFIQAYKINGERAVHLNPRPRVKDAKSSKAKGTSSSTCCEACGRHIQDLPNRFCSIACKVSIDLDKAFSEPMLNKVVHQISNENGCGCSLSLSDSSSSEVIQAWLGSSLRPRKILHKRKGIPRRAPMW